MPFRWLGKQYTEKVEAALEENLERATLFLEGDIKQSFGRVPGVPEVVIGRLRGAIKQGKVGRLRRWVGTGRGPGTGYAVHLELGFRKGGRIYRYPYLRPSLMRNRRTVVSLVGRKV